MDDATLYWIIIILILLLIVCIIIIFSKNNGEILEKMDCIQCDQFPFQTFVINLDRKQERYNYVAKQLDDLGISKYQKWTATDGFKIDSVEMIANGISQKLIDRGKGLAGCASSHVKLWKHIRDNKLDWTLILEDDVHFHPQFISLFYKYWKRVPIDAKIVFPGFYDRPKNDNQIIIQQPVMCLHAYMLNHSGAKYLLSNLLPMDDPIDQHIIKHFKNNYGSFIFNGRAIVNGIRPDDYKIDNGDKCMFNGIIYQNREEYGRTIYNEHTTFNIHD